MMFRTALNNKVYMNNKIIMKNITFICLLLVFTSRALCQTMPVDKETGRITYTEIVKCDSADAKNFTKRLNYGCLMHTIQTNMSGS